VDLLTLSKRRGRVVSLVAALLLTWPVGEAGGDKDGSADRAGRPAVAQVFSPGALIQAHAHLDSLGKCSACHSGRNRVDRNKCLGCHKPLRRRISMRKGYHGRADVRNQACEKCHKDHQGREAPPIDWPNGARERFPHSQAGWSLKGKHRTLSCEKCHESRRITDQAVLGYLEEHPETETFLGLSTRCVTCHFDEHRGTLGDGCDACHDEAAWKPAPGFDHARSWRLEGSHQRVTCVKCHPDQEDPEFNATAFPTPRARVYARFKPVSHESCTACHRDPHRNRFGSDCLACHNQETWRVKLGQERVAFHRRTAFPLEGRHQSVPCERCHRTGRNGKRHFKPIPHDTCQRCHPNAHPDIPDPEMETLKCTSCHSYEGYLPVNYGIERHATTRFPLEDAHLATPCAECHLKKLGQPFQAGPARRAPSGKLSSLVLSPWRLRAPGKDFSRCTSCHETPHRDQFQDKRCLDCHEKSTWRLADTFDHRTRTRYPLEGRHRQVPCAKCHLEEQDGQGTFVRYRPLDTTDCNACHPDRHVGQFTRIEPRLTCSLCHTVEGFKERRFQHDDPAYSDWPLEGKHAETPCSRCHPRVSLDGKTLVTVYRPTPKACAWCHVDQHEGAYVDAGEIVQRARGPVAQPPATPPWGLPSGWPAPGTRMTDCSVCHTAVDWHRMSFDHALTRFPLRGRHVPLGCRECHQKDQPAALPTTCDGCHEDVHRGTLGTDCASCHDETDFDNIVMALSRHARTGFPLTGKHAMTPCTECHQDVRDLGFGRTPTACVACHNDALARANDSVDHTGFATTCETCHTPIAWEVAAFIQHDACFPIRPGTDHAGIACNDCHVGTIPPATGTCAQSTFSCTSCHGCETSRHQNVNGYECADRKCYQCHPGG